MILSDFSCLSDLTVFVLPSPDTLRAGPYMHEIARPGNLAFPISLATKLRLYYVYILPDTWSVTEASRQRLDAFDQWCLHRLRIPYTAHVTNVSVRSQTDQPPVSSLIQQRRLKLFGHITRAAASEDHSRACATSIH